MSLPETVYELRFSRQDGRPDEVQQYTEMDTALEVFRLFFSPCSEEMYKTITLASYNFRLKTEKLLFQITFVEKGPDGRLTRKDWRNWKPGRQTVYEYHDFDGYGVLKGVITETAANHAIMEADGMHLWIDDDTGYMFR
ncbi:MAG: hypothetical protein LKE85_12215 [Lachnospiraceae bacterium]|jgi:hypothetical protein|nr:hypothetical protein [Lachnospiraceae bacterium]